MKKVALVIVVLISVVRLMAQEQDLNRVMIIPFDPNMYFSDSDEKLAEYNDKSVKEVRTMFRYGLNVNLNAEILSMYETRPLLSDTAHGAREDLYAIYQGISYFQDKSMSVQGGQEEQQSAEKKKFFGRNGDSEQKEINDDEAHTTSKLRFEDRPKEYINVKIYNPEMLQFLKQKYGTGLFVFVNQFNLVTNYEHCLDRATNNYEREVKVHFSIFDHTGKQLAGDVAIAKFGSNTNDMMEIMKSNFPVISEYLASNLPNKVKPVKTQYEKDMEYLEQLKQQN